MSAKWRALQHRHNYTYNTIIFPQSYINCINSLDSGHSQYYSKFIAELKVLISLNSTYAQVHQIKNVSLAFGSLLLNEQEGFVSLPSRLYLELLFLDNSVPQHKALLSILVKNQNFRHVIVKYFRSLCKEYGNEKSMRFCVSRVILSMMGSPKLDYLIDVVKECVEIVVMDVVFGLNSVVSDLIDRCWSSPIVMEQCQDALSCLYYLLQRFPDGLVDSKGGDGELVPKGLKIMEMVLNVILNILKLTAFSRDCFVAAGICFCSVLQACLDHHELSVFIIEGMFYQKTFSSLNCNVEFENVLSKVPFYGDIRQEIRSLSVLSRLCLISGILTAISRTVLNIHISVSRENLSDSDTNGNGSDLVQTILYDWILPELCNYCENPTDSHFNFYALTVLHICVQQIKASILANHLTTVENYDPIPSKMGSRILRIIWNNMEDPLSRTVKQVHLIFDIFLDIQSTLHWIEGSDEIMFFLRKIATDLLCLGPHCKGRYVPLASLTRRLGAKIILDMSPNLVFETVLAYIDDDVCSAATSFLKCFLEYLRDECWKSYGIEKGYAIYRRQCLPPILYGLSSGVSKLRSNLNTYVLQVLLEIDLDCIFPMLAFISIEPSEEDSGPIFERISCRDIRTGQEVAILVSLLKVCRSLALIEGNIDWCDKNLKIQEDYRLKMDSNLYAIAFIKNIKVKIPVHWLVLALTHVDESLRMDAADSLFLNQKTASLPSHFELSLMKEAVLLNMRCSLTAFQMKWLTLFRKFFSRVRTALERQLKHGNWRHVDCNRNEVNQLSRTNESEVNRADDLFQFMKWLSRFLFFSCYPSSSHERKIMSMELISLMIDVWCIRSGGNNGFVSPNSCISPFDKGFTSPESTLLLLGSIVDSWDKLRVSLFYFLLQFPTPLPGISDRHMVQTVIAWAKKLVCSPRVRESDAGALILRLIFKKYVVELGWMVNDSVNGVSFHSQPEIMNDNSQICKIRFPVIEYIKSLIGWLQKSVENGGTDLSEACKGSFVHGILLALRYTFEELDWNSDVIVSNVFYMRCALNTFLELVMKIKTSALWVVSSDGWYQSGDTDMYDDDDDAYSLEYPIVRQLVIPSTEENVNNSKLVQDVRSPEQTVMVGCWLAMKEVSLLFGTIITKIPLPSNSAGPENPQDHSSGDIMFDSKQLETIGNYFLEVLLKMKHSGAIDKTQAGFAVLCNRLLCSNNPTLCKLTEFWMEQLMERILAKEQTVDDLLRRSAGITSAFIALFLSEPEGTPKVLLPRALQWLIDVANSSLSDPSKANNTKQSLLTSTNEELSKTRNEGVIPTVHAFNALRATFNDTKLATDTSGFASEALIISIRAFSSQYWEIRNSACLLFTALVRRMVGFLNVHGRDSSRRALSGLEFFHRYPSLYPFLFNQLKIATECLGDGLPDHSSFSLANSVHPSLCPILVLMSRLKPSTITGESGDSLDPFMYMPFIRRCSTQGNLRVRVFAARALTGLVSNEKLPSVIFNIASELPFADREMSPRTSFNSIHGVLLQLSSLLDINCRSLTDFSKKGRIVEDMIQIISARLWIGRPRLCPCPILNSTLLVVLDHMLSIVRTCQMNNKFGTVHDLLLKLSSECLDLKTSKWSSYYDPTIIELRKQAAISYFNCIFQASKEPVEILRMPQISSSSISFTPETHITLEKRLILSMSDESYEVRLATLKWLFQLLKSMDSCHGPTHQSNNACQIIHNWAKTSLQRTLMNLLTVEKSHRCMHYLLRILFTWNINNFQKLGDQKKSNSIYIGEMVFDDVIQFWDKLVSLYKIDIHSKTQEAVICCMGICIKQFSNSFMNCILSGKWENILFSESELDRLCGLYGYISYFVELVKQCSASSEPVNKRIAATESIVACGLLEQSEAIGSYLFTNKIPSERSHSCFKLKESVNMYARLIVDMWFTCIMLLEDEDGGIRKKLSASLQSCLTFASKNSEISEFGNVPTQVEKVIVQSFDFMSSTFGHWIEYFDYLSRWVLNAAENTASKGDIIRQIFDKEIDNYHEEKLLICQICCSHLEKLPISKYWEIGFTDKHGVWNFLVIWRKTFADRLVCFAKVYVRTTEGVDWIGGVGNHKDAFLPLYVNLLSFYALSKCILSAQPEPENIESQSFDIAELGQVIKPYLKNPMIGNLYLLVVKLHNTVDPLIPELRGIDSWDNFEPYFLLR